MAAIVRILALAVLAACAAADAPVSPYRLSAYSQWRLVPSLRLFTDCFQLVCKDERDAVYCTAVKSYCFDERYVQGMSQSCAKTCGFCTTDMPKPQTVSVIAYKDR